MSNRTWTRYAARTGEILDTLSLPDVDAVFDRHNTLLLEGTIDGSQNYVVSGVAIPRPAQQTVADKSTVAADGVEVVTITGIPESAALTVHGPIETDPVPVSGGTVTMAFDLPGEYLVQVEKFPYLPWETTINAS